MSAFSSPGESRRRPFPTSILSPAKPTYAAAARDSKPGAPPSVPHRPAPLTVTAAADLDYLSDSPTPTKVQQAPLSRASERQSSAGDDNPKPPAEGPVFDDPMSSAFPWGETPFFAPPSIPFDSPLSPSPLMPSLAQVSATAVDFQMPVKTITTEELIPELGLRMIQVTKFYKV